MSKIKLNTNVIYSLLDCDINIVSISDIHDDGKEKRRFQYARLLSSTEVLEPDYILVSGDMIESKNTPLPNIDELVKNLGSIAPTIVSVGNHEKEAERDGLDMDWFYELERHSNVYPLDNKSIILDNIQFTGFNPTLGTYLKKKNERMDAFIEDFKNSKLVPSNDTLLNIMLVHNPEFITMETLTKEEVLKNYHLFISGHTHNGCTPSFMEPFMGHRGLLGPYWTLFPKNCRGLTDIYDSKLFINKGFRKFTQEIKISDIIDHAYPNDVHQLLIKRR